MIDAFADVDVAVLDHDLRRALAPDRVPRAHALAAERALDARLREPEQHHAVELAGAADRHGAGRRAERRHDPGQHAIALEPVEAGDVKRDLRSLAVRGPALKLDVGLRRRHPALAERDPLRIERVRRCGRRRAGSRADARGLNGPASGGERLLGREHVRLEFARHRRRRRAARSRSPRPCRASPPTCRAAIRGGCCRVTRPPSRRPCVSRKSVSRGRLTSR